MRLEAGQASAILSRSISNKVWKRERARLIIVDSSGVEDSFLGHEKSTLASVCAKASAFAKATADKTAEDREWDSRFCICVDFALH
jgi:hypothetical protein